MRKTLRTTIDGQVYESTQLGALEGRKLYLRFIKLLATFAPLLASLRGMVEEAKKSAEGGANSLDALVSGINDDAFMAAISEAVTKIDPEEFEVFWNAYAEFCFVMHPNGREQLSRCFDEHFAGRYGAMTKLFLELTKLNFGGFLAEVGNNAPRAEAPTSSP